MQNTVRTPAHLWIIGMISLLWNAFGAFDYLATQKQLASYMSHFTAEQIEYFNSFPTWMEAAWGLGVWGAFFGSLALLLRKSWAVWLFGASLLGLAASTLYNFILTDGAEIMGAAAIYITAAIWAVALFLFFYARTMAKRHVLR
ncbi:hypothetical protein [Elongatibacter sediminis]|uniref:Sugar transporter n=1 Tax=Elongatibacter sediminis TaxID=3119006 RepID=A0AAW9R9G7_9GAMM